MYFSVAFGRKLICILLYPLIKGEEWGPATKTFGKNIMV